MLALPDGLTARPMHPDDVVAAAALLADAERVDDTGEHERPEDLTEWWVNDLVGLPRDSQAVFAGEQLVGYALVIAPPTFRGAFDVELGGCVHPDWRGRGVGRALLGWELARGAEVHAERHPEVPARLSARLVTSMTAAEALVRRAGLTPRRWFFSMQRPLTDLPERRAVPGVHLVPFDRARDDEVRRAHNASFTEHWGSSERDETTWRTWFTGQRAFRPDLSVLAVEDGAVVGYALAYVHESDTLATGVRQVDYGQIGVLPAARGRGLATAVIAAALHTAAGADCQAAGLTVDSENGSGALGLYEGLGFRARRTHVDWVLDLPPVDATASRFRPASAVDLPMVLRAERDYIRALEPAAEPDWTQALDRNLELWIENLHRTTVLELAGQPAGFVMWRPEQSGAATVITVQVFPQFRRRGLGGQLLEKAADQVRAAGIGRLELGVHRDNPARLLYERAGFTGSGEDGEYLRYAREP